MAGQDAELQLKVSLDLAFFRQQLSTIGAQLGGQSLQLNVQFNKKSIADQYRLLDRYVRGRKFNVELNLVGGLTKNEFEKIKGRLDDLRELRKIEIPVSIKNGATGKEVQQTIVGIKDRIGSNQQIRQGGGKLRIATSIKPSITNADISDFKRAVREKLSGISVKIKAQVEGGASFAAGPTGLAGLQEYMRSQGLSGGNMPGAASVGRRAQFENAVANANAKELQRMMRQADVAGRSKLTTKAQMQDALSKISEAAMESILGSMQMKMRDPLPIKRGFLDQIARAVFWMAGVDPAYLRQQAAQRRALPAIDFPAVVPQRNFPIGPSSTGRALPPGAIPQGLPGTAFAKQKYLPTALGEETKKILRDAANAFLDAIRQGVRTVKVRDLGAAVSRQPLLRPSGLAGLLSAGVGREPSRYATGAIGGESREQMMARRTAEAYARSALRGMDVMGGGAGRTPSPYSYAYRSARPTSAITPYAGPGAIVPVPTAAGGGVPPTPPAGGGRGGFGGFGGFGRALGGLSLPGSNAIRELGSEFAFATKQVLLFGQAYKLLGFLQDFPGQVMSAVSSLQSFRNTLNTVSTSANEAASSNQLILDLASRFNVPLQSMRDGFTKLYASMQPAGFSGEQIRGLFTGVSKAAATFGMSADKVDRVNYAFAQMASKGQVMSEELKGQLGDVLPGAMALFAQAAGFKGPKAIQDFSAALEDEKYKGEAMVALLNNVSIVMNEKFGPGAEGAAKTFQGAINNMQNSVTLLYESFEPVAVGFLNSIVTPLSSGIKTLTDGFNAFFNSTAAKTAGGFAIARELERLKPAFEGIRANAGQVVQTLGQLARIGLDIGKIFLQIAGNPLVGYLAKLYAIALPINMMLGVMRGLWIANSVQLLLFNARVASGTSVLSAFRAMMATTGATASVTAGTIRTAGLTLRTFFAATGVGLVVAGISVLIERFMAMNQALADTKDKALGAAQAIRIMSSTEARRESQVAEADVKVLQRLLARPNKGQGAVAISQQEKEALGRAGVRTGRMVLPGQLAKPGTAPELIGYGQQAVDITQVRSGLLQRQSIAAEAEKRIKDIQFQEKEGQKPMTLAPIPATAGEEGTGKGKGKALRDAEQLAKQAQQRRIEEANFANDMQKITFDRDVQLSDAAFEHKKSLIDALNEYELSGLNDMQARQLKFAQDLKKIQLNAIDVVRKELQKANEAQMNVVAAQRTAEAAGSTSAGGVAIFGETGRVSNAKDWVHGHFQTNTASLATLIGDVVPVVKQLLSQGIPVELSGGQKFNTRMSDAEITALLRKGATQHGHSGDGRSIDLFVPKGTTVPAPLSDVRNTGGRGGVTGVLPGSGQSWVGHLDPRSKSGTKQSSAAFSMETRSQKESQDLVKEQAKASAQLALQQLEIQNALKLAYAQTATVIKANIDSIFPVEKQKLDLRLQQSRHTLLMQGMPQEYIDYEEKRAVATKEAAMAEKVMRDNLNEAKAELKVYNDAVARGTKLSVEQQANVTRLTGSIAALEKGLLDSALQQREYNIVALEGAIATMKQADVLKAMEGISGRVNDAVSGVVGTYKTLFKEIATGTNSVEALKKAQDALADQALTMFLDFAMKPVEDFFRKTLGSIFGVPDEETKRKETLAKLEAQLAVQKEIAASTKQTAINTGQGATMPSGATQGQAMGLASPAGDSSFSYGGGNISPLTDFISGQFATDLSSGLNSLQSSADAYASALSTVDASVRNSTINISNAAEEAGPNGATGKKWQESLGKTVQGIGIAAGSIMGIAAGISQVKKGGTANVLGGIGSILLSVGGAIGGFGKLFGVKGFATGGIASGGFVPFRAFANGGTVQGPTLGLVGEGRYNEAVVPLPDGKSIPVQLGGSSSRDLISPSYGANVSPVLSMSFETTTINGVEYVSRDQLETAMMETRRLAAKDGANRGAALAIDRLQHSPNTRRRIGMR